MIISENGGEIWVQLPTGEKTVIAVEDKWILEKFPLWGITGSKSRYVFAERSFNTEYSIVRERVYLHRLIIGLGPRNNSNVDHKDRDRLNNRRSNLRICSNIQNMANVAAKNGKRYKGVFLDKRKALKKPHSSYISYIDAKNAGIRKRKYLGRFKTAEQAAVAYNKAAKEIHGEFAFQNKIK